MTTEAGKRAVKKYQLKRDSIMLRPSLEEGRSIRQAAVDAGESVQRYILGAVKDRMERDIIKEDVE